MPLCARPFPAAGPYCEWVEDEPGVSPDNYDTFEEYKDQLRLECEGDIVNRPTFTWKPDADTPDLVYYQVSRGSSSIVCSLLHRTAP